MRYAPPIKGKLKKSIMSPVQPMAFAQDIGSVSNLLYELRALRDDIVAVTNNELDKIDQKIAEVDARVENALQLEKGEKGEDADELKIAQWVLSNIEIPKDGRDGKDADEAAIVAKIAKMIPKSDDIAKDVLKRIPENKASLKVIQEKIEIDPEVLMGHLERLSPKIKDKLGINELDKLTKILDRRYIHGGGDTVSAGTNITITRNANGDKVINASSGGAFTSVVVTPTPDDTTTVYTAASPITAVVINGSTYINGSNGMGGTISISGTTITLPNPVGDGGDIYGIA